MTLSNKKDQLHHQQQQQQQDKEETIEHSTSKPSTQIKSTNNCSNSSYLPLINSSTNSNSINKLKQKNQKLHYSSSRLPYTSTSSPKKLTPCKRKSVMLGIGQTDKHRSSSSSAAANVAAAAAAASSNQQQQQQDTSNSDNNNNNNNNNNSNTHHQSSSSTAVIMNNGELSQQQQQQQQSYEQQLQTSAIGYGQAPQVVFSVVRNLPQSSASHQQQQQQQQHVNSTQIKRESNLMTPNTNNAAQSQHVPSSSQSQQHQQQQMPIGMDMNDKNEPELVHENDHHHANSSVNMGGLQHDGTNDQDEEMSTAQRLLGVTIESPSSPGGHHHHHHHHGNNGTGIGSDGLMISNGYKRMRSSADSDAGSSSCKDIDESEVLAPDSVPALIAELRQLLDYVASKPTLQHGSASFIRDYLRTMLIKNSKAAKEAIEQANNNWIKYENEMENIKSEEQFSIINNNNSNSNHYNNKKRKEEFFKKIPDELIKHILSFLDGKDLAKSREVCKKWNDVCDDQLWKTLCLDRWKSLESDEAIWKLIDRTIDIKDENKWRLIYPKVNKTPQWKCRLQKTGRFICNLIAHQISGASLSESGLPNVLVVERRFNIMHLATFVLPDASVLYFEPEKESDRAGFDDFIQYLDRRTRAGLALEEQRRFIFIPPCDYTRNQVDYQGKSLLGVVQHAYPPLAP